MTTWAYIGCKTDCMPKEVLDDPRKLSGYEIKQIIESVPIIRGELIAANEEAVISLLLSENIFPLKLHAHTYSESRLEKLKLLRQRLIKDN